VSDPIQSAVSILRAENNDLLASLTYLLDCTETPPDANCSCHQNPPCSDCVEFGGLREAISEAKASIAKATARKQAEQAGLEKILRQSLPDEHETAPPVPESLLRSLRCGDPDEELLAGHEANPESFREPLPFEPTRHRYFRETSTGMEWVWNGVKMTTEGEDSIFTSPAEILECLDVVEVDEFGNPLEPK